MPDGQRQEPGGWNRIVLYVDDLEELAGRLRGVGTTLRNDVEVGPGGSQIQILDPDGNPIEIHEAPALTPAISSSRRPRSCMRTTPGSAHRHVPLRARVVVR